MLPETAKVIVEKTPFVGRPGGAGKRPRTDGPLQVVDRDELLDVEPGLLDGSARRSWAGCRSSNSTCW